MLFRSNVRASLFEPNDVLTADIVKTGIENVINYYEPRAKEVAVNVIESIDSEYLTVNVIFYVINNTDAIDLTLNLKRVR